MCLYVINSSRKIPEIVSSRIRSAKNVKIVYRYEIRFVELLYPTLKKRIKHYSECHIYFKIPQILLLHFFFLQFLSFSFQLNSHEVAKYPYYPVASPYP